LVVRESRIEPPHPVVREIVARQQVRDGVLQVRGSTFLERLRHHLFRVYFTSHVRDNQCHCWLVILQQAICRLQESLMVRRLIKEQKE
jgi:hypothetical protein